MSNIKKFEDFLSESNKTKIVRKTVYHGSSKPLSTLNHDIFWTDKKKVAKAYGKDGGFSETFLTKAVITLNNPHYSDAVTMDEIYADIEYAKELGTDSLIIESYDDGFDVFDNYITFNESQITILSTEPY